MAGEVTGPHDAAVHSDTDTDIDILRSGPDSIFGIAPFALIETDAGTRVLAASAAAERLMQIPPGSLRGRTLLEFIPREEQPVVREHIAEALDDAAGMSWCAQLLPGLGGRVYVRLTVTGARGEDRIRWLIEDLTPTRVALLQEKRLTREREARVRAERGGARFDLLAETSIRLAAAADAEHAMRHFAECLLPEFADICEVDLADANGATGRHVFVGHDRNGNGARPPSPTRSVASGRLAHSMTASLASGGRMFGSVTIGRLPVRETFEDDDFTLLRAMCAQLAARLAENATPARRDGRPRKRRREEIERRVNGERRGGGDRRTPNATLA